MKQHFSILLTILFIVVTIQTGIVTAAQLDEIIPAADSLELTLELTNSIELLPTSSSYNIEKLTVNISRFPQETSLQSVSSIQTTPPHSEKTDESYIIKWIKPKSNAFPFSVVSTLRSEKEYATIRNSYTLPIQYPSEYNRYTEPTTTIDSADPAIIQKAEELRSGSDNLYAFTIQAADWVHTEIAYNLSSMTAEASQKASWVLSNRQGVCDEITSLFIALLRSQDIPTRFVSGLAYSNVVGDWEFHGWAEVYFPDVGWVPYDVTFGQYGYLDAGHITLQEQLDPTEYSINYEWMARNVKFKDKGTAFETAIHSYTKDFKEPYEISTTLAHDTVGFGSHNLLEVEMTNTKDYYVTTSLQASQTQHLTYEGSKRKTVTLAPFETKYVYWDVTVSPDLDSAFSYSFPIAIQTSHMTSVRTSFEAISDAPHYDMTTLETFKKQSTIRYLHNDIIDFSCVPSSSEVKLDQPVQITCEVSNNGERIHRNLDVCFQKNCKTLTKIEVDETKTLSFSTQYDTPNTYAQIITLNGTELYKTAGFEIDALDTPEIAISDVVVPQTVSYNREYEMRLRLEKESFARPQDTNLIVFVNEVPVEWQLGEIVKNRELSISLDTKELTPGENNIDIAVTYYDKDMNRFVKTHREMMTLQEPTSLQKVEIAFNSVERWFTLLFDDSHDELFAE
jgi:transglutaminase-like putative cysteine protease